MIRVTRGFGATGVKIPVIRQGTIAERHGKTARQVALNFLTRRKSLFTIPKASKVQHVRENAGAAGWELTDQDLKLIDAAFPPAGKNKPLPML